MTILNIVKYPEKILFQVAEKVNSKEIDQYQSLIKNMIETIQGRGLGLAAPQVNVSKRIIIYRGDNNDTKVLINPTITISKGKITSELEGCLSIPNIRRDVKRARIITVEGLDRKGNPVKIEPWKRVTSIVLQHEIDHLNGITILDNNKKRNLFKQRKGGE